MNVDLLKQLLATPRGHGSVGEIATGRVLVRQFGFQEHQDDRKEALAFVRRVKSPIERATNILWSCHIDTVHDVKAGKEQKIVFDAKDTMLAASNGVNPLGADNSAGMWMLLEMIEAGVPGTYVFHRGEERGGIGSKGMAQWWADEVIKGHTHAIAFDRKGVDDIITHQWPGRCCSDKFALQYASLLNTDKNPDTFVYEPSKFGSFTDTASYIELIPECTNTSVGYHDEHGPHETLDLEHLFKLRDKVIEVFKELPEELIVERKVTDKDDDRWGGYGGYGGYNGRSLWDYPNGNKKGALPYEYPDPDTMDADDVLALDWATLREEVKEDPGGYADLLVKLAYDLVMMRDIEEDRYEEVEAATLVTGDEDRPGYDG